MVQALQTRGYGSLCFYGPPGSGKTALAPHLAEQMGRPLALRQAGDLASKFIDETEQNMAAMFAEAERAALLDEADSILQDRRGAQRTYEATEIKEMLQNTERHKGVFICTTNLFDCIDRAALRRFTFKIRFKTLAREQRHAMFVSEALGGQAERLSPELQHRMDLLDQLCLGDFAAVQRQAGILGGGFDALEFLEQLEAEHRIKPEVRESRSVGFMQ
ncbi:MAG: AAA family ATPase [Burkholderiales bacterium]|nr:AAA family ATPase [Burkholderiales bacterium]